MRSCLYFSSLFPLQLHISSLLIAHICSHQASCSCPLSFSDVTMTLIRVSSPFVLPFCLEYAFFMDISSNFIGKSKGTTLLILSFHWTKLAMFVTLYTHAEWSIWSHWHFWNLLFQPLMKAFQGRCHFRFVSTLLSCSICSFLLVHGDHKLVSHGHMNTLVSVVVPVHHHHHHWGNYKLSVQIMIFGVVGEAWS